MSERVSGARPAGRQRAAARGGTRFPCARCGAALARAPRVVGGRSEAPAIRCPNCCYQMFDYPRVCVGMLVVKGGDMLVLTRGHRPKRGFLDLPGGFLEAGEALLDGARRELLEETGLGVADPELLGIYWDRYHLAGFGYFPTMNFYFVGRWKSGVPRPADDAAAAAWRPIRSVGRPGDRLAWRHMRDVLRDLRRRLRAGRR